MKKVNKFVLLSLGVSSLLSISTVFCSEDDKQIRQSSAPAAATKEEAVIPFEINLLRELAREREARKKKVVADEVLIKKVFLEQSPLLEKQEKPKIEKKLELPDVVSSSPHNYSPEDYRAWVSQLSEDELWKTAAAVHNIEYFISEFKYSQLLRQKIEQENQHYEELMKQREHERQEEEARIQRAVLEYQEQQEKKRLEEEEASRLVVERIALEERDREYAELLQQEMGGLGIHPVVVDAPELVGPQENETFDERHARNPEGTYEDWLQQL